MAFGQPSGPPATARQLRDLTALIEAAGHTGFRDARGPLGLTQRQAGGRFTQDEAAAFIVRLEAEAEAEHGDSPPAGGDGRPHAPAAPQPTPRRNPGLAGQLRRVPDVMLAAELRRRGWSAVPPGATEDPATDTR